MISTKSQLPNSKQITNLNIPNKPYDLEERTLEYAKLTIRLCKKTSKNTINFKLVEQLIRATGSVGANYREANESLSKKDFVHRIKISRKECKISPDCDFDIVYCLGFGIWILEF